MDLTVNHKIPVLSFRSSGLMYYETPANHSNRLMRSSLFQSNALKLATRERYVGFVTPAVKKRMKKAITLLLQSTPYEWKIHPVTGKQFHHKISFITLTTPDHVNSRDGKWCHKNLLEPMLRTLRRKYQMKSYIWKIELQDNGQVHYHVTADCLLNHSHLKNEWNKLLNRHDMLEDFFIKYGHRSPNSTDIHSVQKVKNLEAYLVKYITKEYQNETRLNCKIWDCSRNLKVHDYFKIEVDFQISQYIRSLQKSLMIVTHYFERAIFLDFKTPDYYANFSQKIIDLFHNYLKTVRSWEKPLKKTVSTETGKLLQNWRPILQTSKPKLQTCQLTLQLTGLNTSTHWRLI